MIVVTDEDDDDMDDPSGVQFVGTDDQCPDCKRRMVFLTFLYGDGRPADDCTHKQCPVCDDLRGMLTDLWMFDRPDLFTNNEVISGVEQWLGPRREWLGPLMN